MKVVEFYICMEFYHVEQTIKQGVFSLENYMVSSKVVSMDFNRAGEGSSAIKKALQVIGVEPTILRRISIISYEAEMNLVIHSDGGELFCVLYPDKVEIVTKDTGPGIVDIDRAMEEGFSTASDDVREMGFGAGLGLPNIKRCADMVKIHSKVGEGTTLTATVYLRGN